MKIIRKYGKVIAFDGLAVLCFIGVILFGWLPGPGGIPLFLLGLSLLAVNHDWAERWLETAKHKGVTFKKWVFPDTPWVQNTYDTIAVTFILLCSWLLVVYEERIIQAICVILICFSLFMFLVNRDRFDKFSTLFKKKTKNKA